MRISEEDRRIHRNMLAGCRQLGTRLMTRGMAVSS
jgi:hypothetical protein